MCEPPLQVNSRHPYMSHGNQPAQPLGLDVAMLESCYRRCEVSRPDPGDRWSLKVYHTLLVTAKLLRQYLLDIHYF